VETILIDYNGKIVDSKELFSNLGRRKNKIGIMTIKNGKMWKKLNSNEIILTNIDRKRNIKLPEIVTKELAEEIGIHIGDGSLSTNYRYSLRGSSLDEKEYYDMHIQKLYKNLFGFTPIMKEDKINHTYGFQIGSKTIWVFKKRILGIVSEKKSNVRIPEIIKNGDVKIVCSFLRGLFDTDGNLFF
jgi:intein/homing endonuclease